MTKKHSTQKELLASLDNAWLGLGDTSEIVTKDILRPLEEDADFWGLSALRIINDIDYIGYACKVLLNVELLPMQCVIIQEMWKRAFPMYIASRGFGKASSLDELILTNNGWVRMGDIQVGDKIYARDGNLYNVTHLHPQGQQEIYKVKLLDEREVECCREHLWLVKYQGKEKTFTTEELFDRKLVSLSNQGKSRTYYYKIPNCEPIKYDKKDLLIDPYLLGCLLGDGSMRGHTPKIASDDDFIVNQFKDRLSNFEVKKDPTNNNYTLVDKDKYQVEKIHPKSGKKYLSKIGNRLTRDIKKLKLNVNCKEKFIPDEYKYSDIEDRMEIIRGLLDTDGSINKNGAIEFTNTCEQLVDDLIEVLRSLGITCKKAIDDRSGQFQTLPQGTIAERKSYFRVFINTSKPIFKLPRKLNRIKTNSKLFIIN